MLEVVATTPSKPLAGCVVVRLDMGISLVSWLLVAAARREKKRAVTTNFYTLKPFKFPTWPFKPKGHIRSGRRGPVEFHDLFRGMNSKVHSSSGKIFLA